MAKLVPPQHLMLGATAYRQAMIELKPAIELGSHAILMPYYMLGGFALELGLKAAILSVRGDENEMRVLGHKLNAAFDAAISCGFAPTDQSELRRLITDMAPSHGDHSFRYMPEIDLIRMPRPDALLGGLDSMLMQIAQQFAVWEGRA